MLSFSQVEEILERGFWRELECPAVVSQLIGKAKATVVEARQPSTVRKYLSYFYGIGERRAILSSVKSTVISSTQ